MSGIKYTSEVLNQRGAPALFEDILANRPAAGFVGRLFFATDITSGNTIFRDNGAAWDVLAGNGGGGGGGVTTLSNGLTLTGSNGTLGGTLTADTTIDGDSNNYNFTFNSLLNFNAYATNVNRSFAPGNCILVVPFTSNLKPASVVVPIPTFPFAKKRLLVVPAIVSGWLFNVNVLALVKLPSVL